MQWCVSPEVLRYCRLVPKQIASFILLNEHSKGKVGMITVKDQTSFANSRIFFSHVSVYPANPSLSHKHRSVIGRIKQAA